MWRLVFPRASGRTRQGRAGQGKGEQREERGGKGRGGEERGGKGFPLYSMFVHSYETIEQKQLRKVFPMNQCKRTKEDT
jgi:hypothetical protein